MADVFLSYAREDAARADQIARGLEAAGLNVFWDNEIPPGQTWADYIEQKLTQCKALIVLWSSHSVSSQWVREEARMGRDKSVLVPVMIDNVQPPFGFGEVQAANLSSWNGAQDDVNWRRFVDAVKHFQTGAPRPATQPMPSAPPRAAPQPAYKAPEPEKKKGLPVWAWVVGAVIATIVVLGIIGSMMPEQQQVAGPPNPQDPQAAAQLPPQQQGQNVYQQQILQRLGQVEQALVAQGFQQVSQPVTGQLGVGQTQNWPVSMSVGYEYHLVGVCDNDCGNIDLAVYDENNVLVASDALADATPVATIAPRWTGSFTAQAVMQQCTVQPCYYALVLYGRAVQ